jgi:pimeloyl-ACP methyl ester carboxylesterase
MQELIYKSVGYYLNTLTKISPKKGGEYGFRLFCKPQRPKLQKQHISFFETARQEDFDFNGLNIKLYEWGTGPKKVLFVHGWQSHSYRWKKYVEQLPKDEHTIIAFDAPGHGQSDGDQFHVPLNAYLIHTLTKKYEGFDAVIAHSIGSMSVIYAMSFYAIESIKSFISMASPSRAEEFFAFYTQVLRLNHQTIQNITNVFQLEVRHQLKDISLATFGRNIKIPGLIIHDHNDPETPYANALELQQVWENARLITTEGLGHNLKSTDVVELVTQYIKLGK